MILEIKKNVLLAPYTTFKIGGPAKFFVEVKNEAEIMEAFKYAQKNNLDFFILGGGSNLLISDNGFEGLVIKIQNTKYKILNSRLECGAGTSLSRLVNASVTAGLSGLEWAIGIPGTIGGAVRGNAGAYGGEIKNILEEVIGVIIEKEGIMPFKYKEEDCKFGYRTSIFKEGGNFIILKIKLKLESGDKENSKILVDKINSKRKKALPPFSSAGSFFKNPIVNKQELIMEFEREAGVKIRENRLPAGWLINYLDLRGKEIGGAKISEEHANFIVNTGEATAEDVIMLMSYIKQQVRDKLGVQLEEEVQLVGF